MMDTAVLADAARIVRAVADECRAGELDASPMWVRLAEGAALALAVAATDQLTAQSQ